MKLPKTYHIRNGCHNCKWMFLFRDHDENDRLYCTLNAPPRPKCGSCFVEEMPARCLCPPGVQMRWGDDSDISDEEWGKHYDAWEQWSDKREVHPAGICGSWKGE